MSTHRDVLEMLAAARPGRLDPDPGTRRDPAEFTSHPQQDAGARRSTTRPARRLVLAGLVPTVAVVAAGAVFVTIQSGSPAPGTASRATDPAIVATTGPAPKSARELLLVAAERTASDPATSGRYWVRRQEDFGQPVKVGPASRPYYVVERSSLTQWNAMNSGDEGVNVTQDLGAAPLTAADKAAWEADGSPSEWTRGSQVIKAQPGEESVSPARDRGWETKAPSAKRYPYTLAGHSMTAADLAEVPTDPAVLKQWLSNQLKTNEIFIANDETLFQAGLDLVFNLPVSPQVRAAAYRIFADVKGATLLGTVSDQLGRTGMSVGFVRKGDFGNWTQFRLIIDPQTGQALAQESWDLGTGKSPAANGRLVSRSLLVSASFTDDTPPAVTRAGRK
jgi:hypothetical protein